MQFSLTPAQQEWQEEARRFALEILKPNASTWEEEARFPREALAAAAQRGFMGLMCPADLGGRGASVLDAALVFEELARADFGVTFSLVVHNGVARAVSLLGQEPLRSRYAHRLARGELLGAFAWTEPGAGSDAGSIQTRAVLEGCHFRVSGVKSLVTNAGEADVYATGVVAAPEKGRRGLAMLLIDADLPGVSVAGADRKMGGHALPTATVTFEDVHVPVENVLLAEGEGLRGALAAITYSRVFVAAMACGLASEALEYALDYMRRRVQFGQRVVEFQGLQWKAAELATEIEAARLLTYRAAWHMDAGAGAAVLPVAMAKSYAADTAMRVTTACVQFLGGYGFLTDHPLERYMRVAKMAQLIDGTTEIQKVILGRALARGDYRI